MSGTSRPITFSTPMVQALLAGRKTQTRRLVRNMPAPPEHDSVVHANPKHEHPYFDAYCGKKRTPENPRGMSDYWCWWTRDDREGRGCRIRYVPGDRLYVRERGWLSAQAQMFTPYVGNELYGNVAAANGDRSVPSIHMPRWASRLTLTVEDVRVERLQAITLGDICEEGLGASIYDFRPVQRGFDAWIELWSSLHTKVGERWQDDPFVVALTFRVEHGNIDRIAA